MILENNPTLPPTFQQLAALETPSDSRDIIHVAKVRLFHDVTNPTLNMLRKDPQLANMWRDAIKQEFDGQINKNARM